MKQNRSLANKILLFVFPLLYLLMLVAMGVFGYYYVQDNLSKAAAVALFSLYLLYRFVNRSRILLREMVLSDGGDEETNGDDRMEE